MPEKKFLQGTFVLIIANLINRVLGFILRVTLVRLTGDEVLGLFQMVYPLFTSLIIICTAGFPVAIAKLIPEEIARRNNPEIYKYIRITLIFVGILTVMITAIFILSADFIAEQIITDKRTYFIIIALAPALIFSPLAASFRGFFQGIHNMQPIALSQITEQISRFLVTIIIINMLSFLEIKYQAAGIAIGIVAGELSGFLLLIIIFLRYLHSQGSSGKRQTHRSPVFFATFKSITNMALPVAIGKLLNSLMWSAEAVLIPRQLNLTGLNNHQAASLYGQLSGMAEPIIFLPTVITLALNKSLLPTVSAAQARNNYERIRNIHNDILKISIYMGLPVTTICILSGKDIFYLLYKVPEAGSILAVLGLSAPFIYYYHVSAGMLQGLGHPRMALLNLSLGSIIKIIGILFLTPAPHLGIFGAALSITLNYAVACLLNFLFIRHLINDKFNSFQIIVKPLLGCSLLFAVNPSLDSFLNSFILNKNINILSNLLFLSLIYLIFMLLTGAITIDDAGFFTKE